MFPPSSILDGEEDQNTDSLVKLLVMIGAPQRQCTLDSLYSNTRTEMLTEFVCSTLLRVCPPLRNSNFLLLGRTDKEEEFY
jgi:hypothetical protein